MNGRYLLRGLALLHRRPESGFPVLRWVIRAAVPYVPTLGDYTRDPPRIHGPKAEAAARLIAGVVGGDAAPVSLAGEPV